MVRKLLGTNTRKNRSLERRIHAQFGAEVEAGATLDASVHPAKTAKFILVSSLELSSKHGQWTLNIRNYVLNIHKYITIKHIIQCCPHNTHFNSRHLHTSVTASTAATEANSTSTAGHQSPSRHTSCGCHHALTAKWANCTASSAPAQCSQARFVAGLRRQMEWSRCTKLVEMQTADEEVESARRNKNQDYGRYLP